MCLVLCSGLAAVGGVVLKEKMKDSAKESIHQKIWGVLFCLKTELGRERFGESRTVKRTLVAGRSERTKKELMLLATSHPPPMRDQG